MTLQKVRRGLLEAAAGVVVLGVSSLVASASGVEKSPEPRYLSPSELHAIVEASELDYQVRRQPDLGADGDLVAAAWPAMGAGLEHPFVEVTPEGRFLVPYDLSGGCGELVASGEPAFARGDLATAGEAYAAAVERFPDCYLAHLRLGDIYWHGGDTPAALERYERAAELNPYSMQVHYFRANALLKLGRREAAYRAYLQALALRPHRPSLEQMLGEFAGRLGATYDPWRLVPRVLLELAEGGMTITVDAADPTSPAWKFYGLCRAIWTLEPGFRPPESEEGQTLWNDGTETHCLRAALQVYREGRAAGALEEDPDIERLHRVDEAGLLPGLVLYEVGGRINPDLLLLLPPDSRAAVLAYLERFVLVRRHVVAEGASPPSTRSPAMARR